MKSRLWRIEDKQGKIGGVCSRFPCFFVMMDKFNRSKLNFAEEFLLHVTEK